MIRYLSYLVWSLLISLMASDIITTTYLMQLGGQEGNVFMQGIVSNPLYHIIVKLALLAVVFIGYLWLEHQNEVKWHVGENVGLIPVAFCCPIFAFAVGNNLAWIFGV